MYNNMPLIEENKKETLNDLVSQIENDLSDLFHNVEEDENITEESYRSIEKQIGGLYAKINALKEEIIFS